MMIHWNTSNRVWNGHKKGMKQNHYASLMGNLESTISSYDSMICQVRISKYNIHNNWIELL